jgi:hypothetical protein
MAAVQGRIDTLEATFADTELFTRQPEQFQGNMTALAGLHERMGVLEAEWLELEMRRESVEG